jgi:glycine cleavage system H lipoate-binding protein
VNLLFSGQVKVGVDDFVQRLLGRVDAITLPPVGVEVKQGQPFAAIRQGGRTAMLTAPVDGVVCAVNGELAKAPSLLKRDPYTRGWLVALRPTNLTANLSRLTVGEGAMLWLKGELARLQEFLHITLTLKRDALVGATAADEGLWPMACWSTWTTTPGGISSRSSWAPDPSRSGRAGPETTPCRRRTQ